VLGIREGQVRDSIGEQLHSDKHIDEEEEAHEQRNIRHISQGADDDLKHLLKVFPELCKLKNSYKTKDP
jgi:GTP1/Obg family GTP-binding protein